MQAKTGKLHFSLFFFLLILFHCNGYNLKDKLENPGSAGKTGGGPGAGTGPMAVYMFRTATTYNGDLRTAGGVGGADGRSGADQLCLSARPGFTFPDNSCMNVRAFISITSSDSIQNMPLNYGVPTNKPIQGPTGIVIDSDWANLLTLPMTVSLTAAGVMLGSTSWWSFSSSAGGVFDASNHCTNGTAPGVSSPTGRRGLSDATDLTWISDISGPPPCDTTLAVLCLCY